MSGLSLAIPRAVLHGIQRIPLTQAPQIGLELATQSQQA